MTKQYLIDHIQIDKNRIDVFACKKFKRQYLLDDFFAVYDDDINLEGLDSSILQIPFILNVIPIIWMSGEEYHIEELDYQLAYSLEGIRGAFRTMLTAVVVALGRWRCPRRRGNLPRSSLPRWNGVS